MKGRFLLRRTGQVPLVYPFQGGKVFLGSREKLAEGCDRLPSQTQFLLNVSQPEGQIRTLREFFSSLAAWREPPK